jgi:amidase
VGIWIRILSFVNILVNSFGLNERMLGRNAISDSIIIIELSFYCPFAERIEKAGAILIGKTNSPSFGFRGTTDNYLFGPTRNPFNLAKNAGGSSGGSAAAVADGMVPLAEGADAGGSIRIPASWCSVFGFKPSYGRVPFFGRARMPLRV